MVRNRMALVSIPWQLRPLKAYFAKTKTKVLFCLPLFCFVLLRNNILDWHCVMKGDLLSWDQHQLCVKRREDCHSYHQKKMRQKYQFFLLIANVHSDTFQTLKRDIKLVAKLQLNNIHSVKVAGIYSTLTLRAKIS